MSPLWANNGLINNAPARKSNLYLFGNPFGKWQLFKRVCLQLPALTPFTPHLNCVCMYINIFFSRLANFFFYILIIITRRLRIVMQRSMLYPNLAG